MYRDVLPSVRGQRLHLQVEAEFASDPGPHRSWCRYREGVDCRVAQSAGSHLHRIGVIGAGGGGSQVVQIDTSVMNDGTGTTRAGWLLKSIVGDIRAHSPKRR